MGTRHLIIVKSEGEIKVAQYGQWDGDPESTGVNIVNFLHEIRGPELMAAFKRRVNLCEWITDERGRAIDAAAEMALDNAPAGFTFDSIYPEFSRRTSTKILWLIMNGKEAYLKYPETGNFTRLAVSRLRGRHYDRKVELNNSLSFGDDRIFCEWAWVIDLDANKLECYCGYPEVDGPKGIFEEFDNPVRLLASFDLPITVDYAEFIAQCTPPEFVAEEE
mgnify:CR=1 FL=1